MCLKLSPFFRLESVPRVRVLMLATGGPGSRLRRALGLRRTGPHLRDIEEVCHCPLVPGGQAQAPRGPRAHHRDSPLNVRWLL